MRLGTTRATGWKRVQMSPLPKEGAFRYTLCAHNEDYDNIEAYLGFISILLFTHLLHDFYCPTQGSIEELCSRDLCEEPNRSSLRNIH